MYVEYVVHYLFIWQYYNRWGINYATLLYCSVNYLISWTTGGGGGGETGTELSPELGHSCRDIRKFMAVIHISACSLCNYFRIADTRKLNICIHPEYTDRHWNLFLIGREIIFLMLIKIMAWTKGMRMTGDPKVQLLLPSTYTVVITLLTGLLHYPPSLPLLRLHNFCVICNRNLTGNISLTWTANFSWRIIGYGQHVQQGVKGGGGDDYNVCLNSRVRPVKYLHRVQYVE